MTVGELRSLLRVYLNDRQSQRWSDADLLILINRAQEAVQQIIDDADEKFFSACYSYSVQASSDAYEFTLPPDCKKVILAERLTSTTPIPAEWVDFSARHDPVTIDTMAISTTTTPYSRPKVYLRGNKIGVVRPTTSYTLRFWYIKRLAALTGDTETSEIPAEFHNLLALHAARLAYPSETREFDLWENEYTQELERLADYIEVRQRQKPRYVNYVPA